jgi:hypothetical protein
MLPMGNPQRAAAICGAGRPSTILSVIRAHVLRQIGRTNFLRIRPRRLEFVMTKRSDPHLTREQLTGKAMMPFEFDHLYRTEKKIFSINPN